LFGSLWSKTLKCNALILFCLFVELSSSRCKFGSPMIYGFRVLSNWLYLFANVHRVFLAFMNYLFYLNVDTFTHVLCNLHFFSVEDLWYPSILWT
jgi:hypothetical protein